MTFNSKYELTTLKMPNKGEAIILYFDPEITTMEEAAETFKSLKECLPEDAFVVCMSKTWDVKTASIEEITEMRNTCDAILRDYVAGRLED